MRLSALLWLGLAALHQSVNADQVKNPLPRSGDASGWQFKGSYQSPQRLPQWRRPQPYQSITQQQQVPIVQPSLSIRQRPIRPVRPLSRQAYVPRMVNDARVVEPYKPVMMDGVVVQPYRPQMNALVAEPYKPVMMDGVVVQPYRPKMTKDMLVQLLPTRGNRFVGLQVGQQGYAKPHEQGYNKISGDSVVSTVNQRPNIEPNSYIAPQTVMRENVIASSILPPATEAPTMIPSCNDSTTPLPQVATQTAFPSGDASAPAALPVATPSSETIDMYDGFQIVEEPIIVDAAPLVQPYEPTMEDAVARPEILIPGNVMVHEYLPTLEDARIEQAFAQSSSGLSQPYRPNVEVGALKLRSDHQNLNHDTLPSYRPALAHSRFAEVSADIVLSPYRPTLQEPVDVGVPVTMAPPPYRPTLEVPSDSSAAMAPPPYRPTLEEPSDASAAMVLPPYRPTLEEPVDVDVSATMNPPPYRPTVQESVDVDVSATMVPPPYRPTAQESVDVDVSATMVPPPYRPTVQESVDVDVSATMVPPLYRPTLEEPSDASAAMVSPPYPPTPKEPVNVESSAAMVPPPYPPTLQEPVGVESSATIDLPSYRPMVQEPVDVGVPATMASPPYRPMLEVPNDASVAMVPPPYRPTLEEPVDVESSATMDPSPYRPMVQESVDAGASSTMLPPQYRSVLEKAVHQPYIPTIDKSGSDAGTSTTVQKTDTLDESTLSSESSTHSIDVPQKDLLLEGSTTLKIQSSTTADFYSMNIESTTPINDSSNDAIVLENEDFVASKTTQNPVYTATPEIVATTTTEALVKGFCAGLEVGIHRHPEKCDGIIRCDGIHTILMPSCPSGLLFNNLTKACDYPTSVPECGSSIANDSSSANCNGHEHGAHIQDPENCGVFWRCVWDEMVKMECPKGTFFNEMTSVCDWPQAVPTCETNGARKTTESEVTTDEE